MIQNRNPQKNDGRSKKFSSAIRHFREKGRRKPHVLMVVENYFPADTRVRNEAQTLRDRYQITVIALKREAEAFREVWNGIEILRIPELRLPDIKMQCSFLQGLTKKLGYMLYYLYFTLGSSFVFVLTHVFRRYEVLHIHNPPDTLFVLGFLAKTLGMKFVFDHHDLSPELFLTRFSQKGMAYKLLVVFEGLCCKLANVVIETNESYKLVDMERHSINPARIFVVRNDPVVAEWQGHKVCREKNTKPSLLYVGCVNPQDGVEFLVKSLHYLVDVLECKNFSCTIVGDGDSLPEIKRLCENLRLSNFIEFPGYVYDRQRLMEYFAKADICLEPAPDNPLNRHSTFIKVIEYMAAGKPIVAFDLKETRYSAGNSAALIPPGDVEAFARAIKGLIEDEELRANLGKKAFERVEQNLNWNASSLVLREAYKRLLNRDEEQPPCLKRADRPVQEIGANV